MNASFYTVSKRTNSTLQPGAGTSLEVTLKEGADLLRPVFLLQYGSIPSFSGVLFGGRYYFITDIRSVRNNLWEIEGRVDVLATYKANILATNAFVLYNTDENEEIIDNRLPAVTTAVYERVYATLDPGLASGSGTLAVSVVGQNTTSTYLLSMAQLKQLMNATAFGAYFVSTLDPIDDQITGSLIDDIVKSLMSLVKTIKALIKQLTCGQNLMDCIKSVVWYPWAIVGDGSSGEIYLGQMPSGVTAAPVYNPIERLATVTVAIPWQADDWRRNAPYHHIYLYIPFIGSIELNPSDLIDSETLTILPCVNKLNGNLNIQVEAQKNNIVGIYSASTGVSIPVGASNITPGQVVNSLMQGASATAAAASGNVTMAAALAAASLSSLAPLPTSVGGGAGGAASGLDIRVVCTTVFHDTIAEPESISLAVGTPAMKSMSLGSCSGYVRTMDASVSGSMTDNEREEINNYLNGGVFIE